MRSLTLAMVCLLALCTSPALAQGKKQRKQKENRLAERFFRVDFDKLSEDLDLSQEQRAEGRAILAEAEAELRELQRGERTGERARVIEERLNLLRRRHGERLLRVLTPEQIERFAASNKQAKRALRARRQMSQQRKRGQKRLLDPNVLREELKLGPEQFEAIKRALRGVQLDVRALRKTFGHDQRRMRQEIQLLRREVLEDVSVHLDPEQTQLLEDLIRGPRRRRKKRARKARKAEKPKNAEPQPTKRWF